MSVWSLELASASRLIRAMVASLPAYRAKLSPMTANRASRVITTRRMVPRRRAVRGRGVVGNMVATSRGGARETGGRRRVLGYSRGGRAAAPGAGHRSLVIVNCRVILFLVSYT